MASLASAVALLGDPLGLGMAYLYTNETIVKVSVYAVVWYTWGMNTETDILTPFVNTDVKIPKSLMHPLTLHEFSCVARGIKTVTVESVQEFLTARFDAKLAAKFQPSFLIKAPTV